MGKVISKAFSIGLISAVFIICCGEYPVGNGDNGDDEPDWEDDIGVMWQLTNLPGDETHPTWAPDGSAIAFEWDGEGDTNVYITSVDKRMFTQLTYNGGTDPCWSPNGLSVVFDNCESNDDFDSRIYAVDITGGKPRFITEGVNGAYDPYWSPDSSQILFVSHKAYDLDLELALYIMDFPDGDPEIITDPYMGTHTQPSWSPDGTKIAYLDMYIRWDPDYEWPEYEYELYIKPLIGTGGTSFNVGYRPYPTWSPDSERVAFSDYLNEPWKYNDIFIYSLLDGKKTRVTDSTHKAITPAWSPDGSKIAFANKIDENADYDIWIVELNE